jgi:adenylate cyclase
MLGHARKQIKRTLAQLGWVQGGFTVALLIIAVLIARVSWSLPLIVDAERALYDMRATIAAPYVDQDRRIVMVTYTDETLFATGIRSPIDRAILTRALAAIDTMGARSIGIDILFDSPTSNDDALVAQLRAMQTPTLLATADPASNPNNIQFQQAQFLNAFHRRVMTPRTRTASIRLANDDDNVVRSWPGTRDGGPSLLTVAMARAGVGAIGGAGPRTTRADHYDHFGGAIRFRMPLNSAVTAQDGTEVREVFAKLPIDLFGDPATAPFLADQIRGAHVLIGGDIVDTDQFETPQTRLPGLAGQEPKPMIGLEVHAHMLAQILDGARARVPTGGTLWLAALLAVAAGAISTLVNRAPWITAAMLVTQALLVTALPFWLQGRNIDTLGLPVAGWAAGWLLGFLAATMAQRAVGAEQRAFAQGALGRYLPRDIAQLILRDPDRLALHGEKRAIYCLFSDLEGFTEMSHSIPPEMVARILNAYLDKLSNVVLAHGGTIDKFVGDAVVAFWGAPIARPDDGEQAAKAVLAMVAAGEAFRTEMAAAIGEGAPAIGRTRVGLHHGEAVIGNFGGEGRIQYTALGDAMNTAARLEAANKALHTRALASAEAGPDSASDAFVPMGRVRLRGRAQPVDIFEPRPDLSEQQRESIRALVTAHGAGYAAHVAEWPTANPDLASDTAIANLIERLNATQPREAYALP